MSSPARVRADACPGVFATHDAADGPLARVRLPGGVVTADRLRALASCAEDLGDGDVHLTSRANVQLRGVRRPGLAGRLTEAGLLPSPSHERVRNVLASPLS
ncbi:precorrin-3B synthase, partial [Amycolatopsis sp. NPDC000673]